MSGGTCPLPDRSLAMEPIDYSRYTMEQLIEIRDQLKSEILKRVEQSEIDELTTVRKKLDTKISQMNFERNRNSF
jgi:hypothetical protein